MQEERGEACFPLYVVILPVILLVCGLSIDTGLLQLKKIQMQTAADAATLGAELEWERCTGNQATQGMDDAAVNGFTNGVNGASVAISQGIWSGEYSDRTDVQVATITQTVHTIFMGALNGGKVTVSATGMALMPPCGYIMNTAAITTAYSVNVTNTASVAYQGMYSRCPLYINNNAYLDSSMALQQYAIDATGTAAQTSINGPSSPPPFYNFLPVTDPLAGVTQPTASACNHTNYSVTTGSPTLSPGTYCGSVSGSTTTPGLKISGGGTITLDPGLYVITGGMHVTAGTITGTGVTLFFTNVSGNTTKHGYGQVIFDGVNQVLLSAPTAGTLVNILFFTDRNWVNTAAQDFQLNDAEYYGNGIWYVTGTGIQLTAKASTPYAANYISMITDSIYVDSSTLNLWSDFSAVTTGNPFRTRAVLVE